MSERPPLQIEPELSRVNTAVPPELQPEHFCGLVGSEPAGRGPPSGPDDEPEHMQPPA